jgi:hypothetical protein
MLGDIKVKSRPLRLAFLIQPKLHALHEAIKINSSLWGGLYNPIIPLHKRAPKAWRLHEREKISMEKRTLGYLRAFDPDFIVGDPSVLPQYVTDIGRPVIEPSEIWSDFHRDQRDVLPNYGVRIFELLNDIYRELFEVKRRFPFKIVLPVLPNKHEVFWAAALGQLPALIQQTIETSYAETLDFEKPDASEATYAAIVKPASLFPRRISSHRLENQRRGYRHDAAYGIFMDATRLDDVVEYWNLRALGRAVIPIPKQFVVVPEFLDYVRKFVKSNYRLSRQNPAISYGTTIIRSSSSEMSELARSLG